VNALLPYVEDRETGEFFRAASEGRLVFRSCNSCSRAIHPPTEHCPNCGSWDTGWRESKGAGRIYSWSVVKHQIHPAFPVPYTLVVVELDDSPDVRLMGRIDGAVELTPGTRMHVKFEPIPGGGSLPQWYPVKEE